MPVNHIQMEEQKNKNTSHNDEIDLIEVARKIWDERRLIYKTVAIFFALRLLIAFGSTKEYKSEAKLLPEVTGKIGRASCRERVLRLV